MDDKGNLSDVVLYSLKSLNDLTGGTRLGKFTLLLGQTGTGKSSLFLQDYFYRSLILKRPQLWISVGDMTAGQIWFRYIQQQTGLAVLKQAHGDFTDDNGNDWREEIDRYLDQLKAGAGYMYAASEISLQEVTRLIQKTLGSVSTLDVYIDHIDHINLQATSMHEKTVLVSNALIELTRRLVDSDGNPRISVNATGPLNSSVDMVAALELLHVADTILRIEPLPANEGGPEKDTPPGDWAGLYKIVAEKNSYGRTNQATLFFNGPRTRFEEVGDKLAKPDVL